MSLRFLLQKSLGNDIPLFWKIYPEFWLKATHWLGHLPKRSAMSVTLLLAWSVLLTNWDSLFYFWWWHEGIFLKHIGNLFHKQGLWRSVTMARVAKILPSDRKKLAAKPGKPIWKVWVVDNLFWNSLESICSELNLLAQTPIHVPAFPC